VHCEMKAIGHSLTDNMSVYLHQLFSSKYASAYHSKFLLETITFTNAHRRDVAVLMYHEKQSLKILPH
jgi:hypothetical protein